MTYTYAIRVLESTAQSLRRQLGCDVLTLCMSRKYLEQPNPPKKRIKAEAEWATQVRWTRRELNDVRCALIALRGAQWTTTTTKKGRKK